MKKDRVAPGRHPLDPRTVPPVAPTPATTVGTITDLSEQALAQITQHIAVQPVDARRIAGSVGTAQNVTSIDDAAPSDGARAIVRLDNSPYDYTELFFDESASMWVSPSWRAWSNHADKSQAGAGPTSLINSAQYATHFFRYTPYVTAGLTLQVRLTAYWTTPGPGVGGTGFFRCCVASGAIVTGATNASSNYTEDTTNYTGSLGPHGNANGVSQILDSDWTTLNASATTNDVIALFATVGCTSAGPITLKPGSVIKARWVATV